MNAEDYLGYMKLVSGKSKVLLAPLLVQRVWGAIIKTMVFCREALYGLTTPGCPQVQINPLTFGMEGEGMHLVHSRLMGRCPFV